ncbi:MAG TPA: hypothetical protein DCY74_03970, partial [Clostridiales bacterium]|nr:hypothetical protein [Clostridiales bacterium]
NQDALALLAKESPIEIEMFVHGAICVSHSGQCLMSSVIGERSGNRGLCAQPCRLPYNGHYPLSIKDMCLADHMQDILTMNIAALKIEGRMKPPGYVYGVTSIYRRLLDERRNATPDEIAYLAALFSRSGFTSGYFTGNMTKSMLGIRREEDKNAKIPPMPDVIFEKKEKIVLPARTHVLPEFISCKKPITKERFVKSARYAHANQIVNCEDLDIRYLPLDKFVKGKANGLIMPYPVLDKEKDKVLKQVDIAIQNGACHALITHLGQIPWFIGKECTLHGDYRLNITNGESACQYERLEDVILSPELTLPQIRDMHFAKSTIIYGHLPLMTLEKPVEEPHLKDRRGVVFPLVRAGGRDVVLNSVPVYMLDKKAALKKAGGGVHLMFIRETPQEVKQI